MYSMWKFWLDWAIAYNLWVIYSAATVVHYRYHWLVPLGTLAMVFNALSDHRRKHGGKNVG
jgi:hypothetical protein